MRTPETATFWLIVALGVLLFIELVIFAILHIRSKSKVSVDSSKPIGLALDTNNAKLEFKLGEEFSVEGLVVTAFYNTEPYNRKLDIIVPNDETLINLAREGKSIDMLNICLAFAPKMDEEGEQTVVVKYSGLEASYKISMEAPLEIIAEETVEEIVGEPVEEIAEEPVEEVSEEIVEEIIIEETEGTTEGADEEVLIVVPVIVDKDKKAAEEPVEEVVEETPVEEVVEEEPVEEVVEEEPVEEVVEEAPVEEVVEEAPVEEVVEEAPVEEVVEEEPGEEVVEEAPVEEVAEEAPVEEVAEEAPVEEVVEEPVAEAPVAVAEGEEIDPLIVYEGSYEAGVLRYDRSFTAKLIQADDELKQWYTELKNELLSYKKIKDRMSWKRETYRFGRTAIARLAIRGKTLCLYLPLNPEEYVDTKYKVEAVDDNTTAYDDTPCLYRIKSERRKKYAKELIAQVMTFIDTKRIERESVDYYAPYEGLVELINKGLVKRIVKKKSSDFFSNLAEETNEAPEQEATEETGGDQAQELAPGIIVVTEKEEK